MRYEFQFLFALVAIGLFTQRLSWKGWALVAGFVACWIALCKIKG